MQSDKKLVNNHMQCSVPYLISAQTLEIRMKLGRRLRQECKYVGPGQQRLYRTVCVTKKKIQMLPN